METDDNQAGGGTWSDNLKKMAEKFQLPGLDLAALLEWQRKDMEALVEANRQAYAGIAALVERRGEFLHEALAQWQAAIRDGGSAEGLAKQADAAKLGVEK